MPQESSTNATPPEKAKKRQSTFQTSPKLKAIINRLKYVGEHVFGGDMAAYAAAVGLSEYWLNRILNTATRLRMTAFAQFVESGVVSAEWLFCGSGPMLASDFRKDQLGAYTPPTAMASQYPPVDTTLLAPPAAVEVAPFVKFEEYVYTKDAMNFLPMARATFHSRSSDKPVVLFLNDDVVCAGVTPVIQSLLKNKVVTHIAMTSAAAVADFYAALTDKNDATGFNSALKMSANAGVGMAEGIARWGFSPNDKRENSILAFAYDNGVSASVHTTFGDNTLQLVPAVSGVEFGSVLGAVSYVDMLVFTEVVFNTAGEPPGTFIVGGSAQPALQILNSVMEAGHRLPTPLDFSQVKIGRIGSKPIKKNLEFFLAGDYRVLFPQFLEICQAVYTGKFERFLYERYGHKILEHSQPDLYADAESNSN